ncbi:hypothetical protein J437_LFUL015819 [Ladona fulva]|uniref:Uncharacterized protein n=1 Tax=Ladona fulva TaxID=123851 RepID=A0A8K0P4L5_LADFU|nr:hypothetical protein J437_LFUL015819 [Ladona fulva]
MGWEVFGLVRVWKVRYGVGWEVMGWDGNGRGGMGRISHCAVRNIVYETCEAIWDGFCKQHMPLLTTEQWKSIGSDF